MSDEANKNNIENQSLFSEFLITVKESSIYHSFFCLLLTRHFYALEMSTRAGYLSLDGYWNSVGNKMSIVKGI